AAVAGAYFLTAKSGGEILVHFSGSSSGQPVIAISKNFVAAILGSYFIVSDGLQVEEKYIGAGSDAKIVATSDMAVALMGAYFVAYVKGAIREKYIGKRSSSDTLASGQALIAASMGDYFVVLDGKQGSIRDKYVGASGKVQVIR